MFLEKAIPSLIMLVLSVWVYFVLNGSKQTNEAFADCKPQCCLAGKNSQLSCQGGCVCLNAGEQAVMQSRGGNSNPYSEI